MWSVAAEALPAPSAICIFIHIHMHTRMHTYPQVCEISMRPLITGKLLFVAPFICVLQQHITAHSGSNNSNSSTALQRHTQPPSARIIGALNSCGELFESFAPILSWNKDVIAPLVSVFKLQWVELLSSYTFYIRLFDDNFRSCNWRISASGVCFICRLQLCFFGSWSFRWRCLAV